MAGQKQDYKAKKTREIIVVADSTDSTNSTVVLLLGAFGYSL